MNMIATQTSLMEKIAKALPGIIIIDNILDMPSSFPFIAVDPISSDVTTYNGGSMVPSRHSFDIYVVQSLQNMENLPGLLSVLQHTRAAVIGTMEAVLAIPRIYASSPVIYGEDVISSTRVSFAKVQVTFPC